MGDWTELEWSAFHAMQDMDRVGVYPSGRLLACRFDDHAPAAVLAARSKLLGSGLLALETAPEAEAPYAESFTAPPPHCESEPIALAGRKVDLEARKYNVALYRIVQGEPGVVSHLGVVTGLSEDSIKQRVARVRHEYPPEELDPYHGRLSPDEMAHLSRAYGRSKDPVVQAFLQSQCQIRRAP